MVHKVAETVAKQGLKYVVLANQILQADGKVIVGGYSGVIEDDDLVAGSFAMVRYNPDGSRDEKFGASGDGTVVMDVGFPLATIASICALPDGKIVAAGSVSTAAETGASPLWAGALARYGAEGDIDPTFGDGGLALADMGLVNNSFRAVVPFSDERILAVGTAALPP